MTTSAATAEGVLGRVVQHPIDTLHYFITHTRVTRVRARCAEVGALCPVTGQPDLYTVTVDYVPGGHVIESKSLKLFLWRYRERGISCEELAADIAAEIAEQHPVPTKVTVTAEQQPRGGIALTATAEASNAG